MINLLLFIITILQTRFSHLKDFESRNKILYIFDCFLLLFFFGGGEGGEGPASATKKKRTCEKRKYLQIILNIEKSQK